MEVYILAILRKSGAETYGAYFEEENNGARGLVGETGGGDYSNVTARI